MKLSAFPHEFPLTGNLLANNTALLVIDMQIDFAAKGGYIEQMGVDLTPLRAPIEPIQSLLKTMRARGFLVAHTRETFQPDLSDVQPHRRYRGQRNDGVIPGDIGPLGRCLIEGEPCWGIIPEVAPLQGEAIFNKRAYGAFSCTDIHDYLQHHKVRNLIITGLTTDCCIQSNLREALDRGYECLVLEDCCGASSRERHAQALALIRSAYAVFGCISNSDELKKFLSN